MLELSDQITLKAHDQLSAITPIIGITPFDQSRGAPWSWSGVRTPVLAIKTVANYHPRSQRSFYTKFWRVLEKIAGSRRSGEPAWFTQEGVRRVITCGYMPPRCYCDAVSPSFLLYCVGYNTIIILLLKLSANLTCNYPLMLGRKTMQ